MAPKKMQLYELQKAIGTCGLYQIWVYIICSLAGLVFAFNNVGMVFLGATPKHWCNVPELRNMNLSIVEIKNYSIPLEEKDGQTSFSSCKMYQRNYSQTSRDEIFVELSRGVNQSNLKTMSCDNGWHYDTSIYLSTIVTKWDLVCDRQWLLAISNSIFMAGLLVGVIFFGALGDRIGRRKILIITAFMLVAFGISTAFAPYYILYVCLRFGVAMACVGMYTTGYVLVIEMIGNKFRIPATMMYGAFWKIGYMGMSGIAYAIRDVFYLHLAFTIPSILYLAHVIVAPESLRWLYVMNRHEDGNKVARHIAKINKKSLPEEFTVECQIEKKTTGFLDLFRTPRLRLRILICCLIWFTCSLVYYGLVLNTANFAGDPYLNTFISAAIEIPNGVFNILVVTFFGRKKPQCLGLIIAAAFLFSTLAVPTDGSSAIYGTVLSLAGKFSNSVAFNIIYMFTAELMPTAVRNVAVGTGSMSARVGGIVAPYLVQVSSFNRMIPVLTFGGFAILSGTLALLFPETKGKDLPETIEDGENLGRKHKKRKMEGDPYVIDVREITKL